MADINAFPIADVTQMASFSGLTIEKIESAGITNTFLGILMSQFYDGTLEPIQSLTQELSQREELIAFADTFGTPSEGFRAGPLGGVIKDIGEFGSSVADAARKAAEEALKAAKKLALLGSFAILGGITLAILILARKVK